MQRRPFDIGGSDESKCQACRKEEGTEKNSEEFPPLVSNIFNEMRSPWKRCEGD